MLKGLLTLPGLLNSISNAVAWWGCTGASKASTMYHWEPTRWISTPPTPPGEASVTTPRRLLFQKRLPSDQHGLWCLESRHEPRHSCALNVCLHVCFGASSSCSTLVRTAYMAVTVHLSLEKISRKAPGRWPKDMLHPWQPSEERPELLCRRHAFAFPARQCVLYLFDVPMTSSCRWSSNVVPTRICPTLLWEGQLRLQTLPRRTTPLLTAGCAVPGSTSSM